MLIRKRTEMKFINVILADVRIRINPDPKASLSHCFIDNAAFRKVFDASVFQHLYNLHQQTAMPRFLGVGIIAARYTLFAENQTFVRTNFLLRTRSKNLPEKS